MTFADKAYQGAHARVRGIGERANATRKVGKVLTGPRCSPHRATPIVLAILVLHPVENPAPAGCKGSLIAGLVPFTQPAPGRRAGRPRVTLVYGS